MEVAGMIAFVGRGSRPVPGWSQALWTARENHPTKMIAADNVASLCTITEPSAAICPASRTVIPCPTPRGEEIMRNTALKNAVARFLPACKRPPSTSAGELTSVVKDHSKVRGKLALCFPDAYTLGRATTDCKSLYSIMNNDPQWACESGLHAVDRFRRRTPRAQPAALLQPGIIPRLCALSTSSVFRSSTKFCYTTVLTMLDLGGVPLQCEERTLDHTARHRRRPRGAKTQELLAPFVRYLRHRRRRGKSALDHWTNG